MKWIKASDRLPEIRKRVCGKLNGNPAIIENSNLIKDYLTVNGNLEHVRDVKWLDESQPQQKEESEKELEERTERNMNVISDFVEHLESENIVVPESVILSFFNA